MEPAPGTKIVDALTLRFTGEDENGVKLQELRASHVAEVLQGLVELSSDFAKAGAFHDEGPIASEVLVRPAQEGSFLLEVVRVVTDNWEIATVAGVPSIGTIVHWATRSMRAEVKDFSHLDNGNVKVVWQDDTAEEVPVAAWNELQKRKPRRKKQLRKIMAPLSDLRVSKIDVTSSDEETPKDETESESFTLKRADYHAVRPEDEIEEKQEFFEVEAQMSAIDFDDPDRWRVKTAKRKRTATVEDEHFLNRVANGLPIRKTDVFTLWVREDATKKNGRTRTKWTVLEVRGHRRVEDDDA